MHQPYQTTLAKTIDDPVHKKTGFWTLSLAAIGVVYGDIGTSPLYAFRESIAHVASQGSVLRADVIGVISLMLWALIAIVLLKYVFILLRLDNRGEGGTLALMALVQRALGKRTRFLFVLGALGAGLFYGDAMLTPAISVLSAVEGLGVLPQLTGRIEPFIMPITLTILVALFFVGLQALVWTGTVSVDWSGMLGKLNALLFNLHENESMTQFLTRRIPSAGGMAVGYLIGFQRG